MIMDKMLSKIFHQTKSRRRNSEPVPPMLQTGRFEDEIKRHKGQRMIEMGPYNLYGTSMDHGYESGTSVEHSRRSSIGVHETPTSSGGRRRYTMNAKMQRPTDVRKVSNHTQVNQNGSFFTDEEIRPMVVNKRRMSVPENVYRRCDFAIMRPVRMFTKEHSYEVVSAFDRHDDPYQAFMKTLTCYDMQPKHSSIVMFDGRTKIRTAVNAISQNAHNSAIIVNMDTKCVEYVFNQADSLIAIKKFVSGDNEITKKSISEFMSSITSSSLICTSMDTSAWEASQILSLNRMSTIPVFDTVSPSPGTALYFLTYRTILLTTVLQLIDFGDSTVLHLKQTTIDKKRVGTWENITKIKENTTIEEIINIFVEKKYSALPVVNLFDQLVGLITRKDVISALLSSQISYQKTLKNNAASLPVMKDKPIYGKSDMTVLDIIKTLMPTDKNSLPIVDESMNVLAIISYGDIMAYIHSIQNKTPPDALSMESIASPIK